MLGKVFGIICIISLIFAALSGNLSSLSNAALDGAAGALRLCLSLCGIMCLWCGIMQVFSDAGVVGRLSRLLSPFLRFFFPTAYKTGRGAEEITANIAANLLGVGNAATPLALRAMEKMQEDNEDPASASADMITLAVLNTASVSILPSTIIALRRAAGSAQPYSVVVPVWICSLAGASLALALTRGGAIASGAGRMRRVKNKYAASPPGKGGKFRPSAGPRSRRGGEEGGV